MDPRKILGVSPTATPEEIQRAYRTKAKKHHPDLGGDAWAFQQVQDAYEELTNPGSKKTAIPKPPSQPRPNPAQQPSQRPSNEQSRDGGSRPRNSSGVPLSPPTESAHSGRTVGGDSNERTWKDIAFGQLPLQTETTWFILINCLDIFLTYMLLYAIEGATEANPLADYFIKRWNFAGAIAFKLAIVAFVCVIAQIVAKMRPGTGKLLLNLGSLVVGGVVVYSVLLYIRHQ